MEPAFDDPMNENHEADDGWHCDNRTAGQNLSYYCL